MAALDTEWQRDVLRLKGEGKTSAEIAEIVGKHAATVRKVIARAAGSTNGNGPHEGQTTVDDFVAPEDDPEHPDTLAEFRGEAGEPVGPMPSRAVDPQDGLFDMVWDDANLLAALEAREETRAAKLSASKAHAITDDEVKALLAGYSLAVGEVARIGRFRIKKTSREGSEVSFTTGPREQLQIAVDSSD